jgi:hypothetical protein
MGKMKPQLAAPPWLDNRPPRLLLGGARLCSRTAQRLAADQRLFAWGENERKRSTAITNSARGGRQGKKRGLTYCRPCSIFLCMIDGAGHWTAPGTPQQVLIREMNER